MRREGRPDPEELLAAVKQVERENRRGRLKIFLGAAAGVGKTYAMLEAARQRKAEGIDVAVGYVETHGRPETEALLTGLEVVARREELYRGVFLPEMDLDAVLARRPELALVDELAHTNAPGSRHTKRFEDVEEILDVGVNVYTTLNIQHLESLNDVVAQITGTRVRETVPDRVFDHADEVELIDLPPEELIKRLEEGKVYVPEAAERAIRKFFRPGNLIALREIALRRTAERVDREMRAYMTTHGIRGPWPAGERVMVCLGPSPMSEQLVRVGRRMAVGLDAEWVAVHIETPSDRHLDEAGRGRVARFMDLAEELGGKYVTLTGLDVAEEVIDYAKTHNVTRIVIGKPLRRNWADLIKGTVVDKIIRRSGGIDVHVISTTPSGQGRPAARERPRSWTGYGAAVGLVGAVTLVGLATVNRLNPTNLVMFYLLAVVFTSLRWGRGPAVLFSILGVLTFDFFLVPPRLSLAVFDPEYLITFAALLAVALVIGTQTGRLSDQVMISRRREAETSALYGFSRSVVASPDLGGIAAALVRHTHESLNTPGAVLIPSKGRLQVKAATPGFDLNEKEMAAAIWTYAHGRPSGQGESTLPGIGVRCQPLKTSRSVVGVLVTRLEGAAAGQAVRDPDRRRLFEAFADQAAVAVERAQLAEEATQTELLVEADRLHTTLLNSISHDLRTPLASIIGALTTLNGQWGQMGGHDRRELIETAREGAERLNRLVGNILDITRLESGSLKLVCDWHDLEDVIGTAMAQAAAVTEGRSINVGVSPDLPLVFLDHALIGQVFLNLLDNAVKYSSPGSPVDIEARRVGEVVEVRVADRGPGVPQELKERIFDKFYRVKQAKEPPGTGLGLAICRGIIDAHHGRIWVEDREGGGSVFVVTLPIRPRSAEGRGSSDE